MLLLSKKSFEKCRKNGTKTRENRISLTRWKKKTKKIEFCRCRNRCLFDCDQFQPFSQSNREGVSSSLTNAKNHTLHSFILSRISPIVANKQISNLFPHFSFSTILKSKRRRKQDKFKTCFANAVEISIISTNLIKITLSQTTIQKEWRLVSFCENC